MNSRDENEDNEKIYFSDDSEDWLNKEDSLFRSKMPLDIPNYNNDENDGEQEFFEGLDREEFDFLGDGDSNLQNFLNPNRSNVNRKTPSLNNEIDNYEQLDNYYDEEILINDRNKRTMTHSSPNLIENSTIGIPEIDKSEIPEELGRLYVKADWKLIYDQLKAKGYTLRKINDEIGSNFRNNLYADRSMRLASFSQLRNLIESDIEFEIIDIYNHKQIKIQKNNKCAELFGIIQSRGNLTTDGKRVVLSFRNKTNLETIKEIKQMMEEEYEVKGKIRRIKNYNSYLININSKGLVKELDDFGLKKGKLTFEDADIPSWIKENKEFKTNYVKGTLMSNAKLEINKSLKVKLELVFKSQPLVNFFITFLDENDIEATIRNNRIIIRSIDNISKLTNQINSNVLNNFLTDNDLNLEKLKEAREEYLDSKNFVETKSVSRIRRDRISYVTANWDMIYENLEKQGYNFEKIYKLTKLRFKNQVYSNYNMKLDQFDKLRNLSQFEFTYFITDKPHDFNYQGLDKNTKTAELTGIILGDGTIPKQAGYFKVFLGTSKRESNYIEYVVNLFNEVLNFRPRIYDFTKINMTSLGIYNKQIVLDLINIGLQPGDKKINQSRVPFWISRNKNNTISCIKGLFDTDGCTYFQKRKQYGIMYIQLKFTNMSIPLLDFFDEFCTSNGIRTSRTGDDVLIQSRSGVSKFAEIVDPEKIKWFLEDNKMTKQDLLKSIRYKSAEINSKYYVSANWKEIYSHLKGKGYNLQSVNNAIGYSFGIQVKNGRMMNITTFRKLQKLIDIEIEFDIYSQWGTYQKSE